MKVWKCETFSKVSRVRFFLNRSLRLVSSFSRFSRRIRICAQPLAIIRETQHIARMLAREAFCPLELVDQQSGRALGAAVERLDQVVGDAILTSFAGDFACV